MSGETRLGAAGHCSALAVKEADFYLVIGSPHPHLYCCSTTVFLGVLISLVGLDQSTALSLWNVVYTMLQYIKWTNWSVSRQKREGEKMSRFLSRGS